MMMMQTKRRAWTLSGLTFLALVAVGCADVEGMEGVDELAEEDELGQVVEPTTETPREDLGKGNGRDVIAIGDSWMDYFLSGGGIQAALNKAGTRYRHYSLSGTTMLSGQIPGQFDRAVRANRDIKTVIMTGGGNDVLITGPADCRRGGPQCQKRLVDIKDSLVKLWTKMAAAGVKDVVYIGYAEGAGLGAAPPEFANVMKNGVGKACLEMTALRCFPIESTPIVRNQYVDGIHPTGAANDRIARAVLDLMEKEGIRR